jgi:hypothetical protein
LFEIYEDARLLGVLDGFGDEVEDDHLRLLIEEFHEWMEAEVVSLD